MTAVSGVYADPAEEFSEEVRPILKEHCFKCHGQERQKGDLDLSQFAKYEEVMNSSRVWQLVLERVQAFEMPPENGPELSFGERQTFMKWLRDLPKPELDCTKLASDRTQSFYRGYVMSRRLNRAEYSNTIRDLFGVELDVTDRLPADSGGGEGFDTTGNALFTSSIHIERYLAVADWVVEQLIADGKDAPAEWVRAHNEWLTATPAHGLAPREAARRVIEDLARRAFRRPVTAEEVEKLLTMFDRGRERGDGFVRSLGLAVKAILISPKFLFLVEEEPPEGGVQPLGAFPLASRLSYFIWSSMPDEELLSLAERGLLLNEKVYREQIDRMLADPKAKALGERFALQWLDLQRLGEEIKPDPEKYPEFDPRLASTMRQEVSNFFNHLFQEDRSLLELIDSDYTFVNRRLADLYGIEGLEGDGWRQIRLASNQRGGVLGMAAVHTSTSFPLRTSPVLRGKWVLEALLGDRVPPPPPGVPELEEENEEVTHDTLREQLEAHRDQPECASCHNKMDPLGFSLEHYDVLGRWRDMESGRPIDAKGTLPSGKEFEGPSGLKALLMDRKEKVMRHLARKMTGFALGREVNKYDECVVNDAWEALKENDFRASVLVEVIATSYPFRHRFYPNQE